ncbi:MAG: hypothetical protein IJY82_05085 [Oscillospiraceae bacterium]|nr:hypothetical protein [Oscillospiraceae bacterium]MBQ8732185.1 hypothetical protein [Oscillospiraceae bacterium]
MPNLDDFHAFQSTSGNSGSGGGSGKGFGCGWVVIVVVVVMILFFVVQGTSWAALETLLALGIIAFFFARLLFR